MTQNRKDALQELLAKVEAGSRNLFSYMTNNQLDSFEQNEINRIQSAFDGSPDAALALFDAVLPGWNVGVMNRINSGGWQAIAYPPGPRTCDWSIAKSPARALLIAILKALIAQDEAK